MARIATGLVFAYAGWIKLTEPTANFESVLLRYGIISPEWIPWIARILPWGEWLLGSFLVVGFLPRLAAFGVSLLAVLFLVTLTSTKAFLEAGGMDCGCFGRSGLIHLSVRQIFFVDLVCLVLALRISLFKDFPGSLHSFLLKGRAAADDTKKRKTRRS